MDSLEPTVFKNCLGTGSEIRGLGAGGCEISGLPVSGRHAGLTSCSHPDQTAVKRSMTWVEAQNPQRIAAIHRRAAIR